MKKITDREYEDYKRLLSDELHGRMLSFHTLEYYFVKANGYDPEKIGKAILEAYWNIKRKQEKEMQYLHM